MYVVAPFSTEYVMGRLPIRYSVENGAKAYITDVPKKLWSLTPPSLACMGHSCLLPELLYLTTGFELVDAVAAVGYFKFAGDG